MELSVREGRRYAFEAFVLDPTRRLLTRDGVPVSLSPTLFDTLLYLVEHPSKVVSKDELLDAVWPKKTVDLGNVSQTIFTLRKALTAAGSKEALIVTAPGEGYRFAQPVEVQSPRSSVQPAQSLSHAEMVEATPLKSARRQPTAWMSALIGASVLVVAGLALGFWLRRTPVSPGRNVVVLGAFQNLARDPQFDGAFEMATRIDLQQSPYVSVLPEKKVEDTLGLMARPKDEPLTAAVTREVCARNNGVAAINGAIAAVGTRYLLAVTATECSDGDVLSAEKAEVDRRDALLPALDRLIGKARRRLGESAASVRRFDAPLLQRRTTSLEALRAYSDAVYDVFHGRRTESIPEFQHAIALDPKFSAAYSDLAVIYSNLRQNDLASASILKAHSLQDGLGEHEKFLLEERLNTIVTGDVPAGLRLLQAWTRIYPDDGSAWSNLSNKENWIGDYPDAIRDGRRANLLSPDNEASYVVFARALLHAGRYDEARAVCDQAIAHHVDGDDLHRVLYQIAIARDNDAAAAAELAWAKGKPGETSILIEACQTAFGRGKIAEGLGTFTRAYELGKSFGLGDVFSAANARLLYDLGLPDLARQTFARVPAGFDSIDYRFDLAEMGDVAHAEALLKAALAKTPNDTLLTKISIPEVRAAEALRRGQPLAAVEALKPAEPYEMRTFDVPFVRGRAFLAAGDGVHAAIEFRKILDHRGVEAVSSHYQLSELGFARALALQHDVAGSRAAYLRFFQDWRNADPDMPLLAAAKAEYAALATHCKPNCGDGPRKAPSV